MHHPLILCNIAWNKFNWFGLIFNFKFIKTIISAYSQLTRAYIYIYIYIPFGVALRLRRICSRDDWFDEQLEEYHQFFKRRKYKNNVIRKGFDQAKNTSRSDALLSKSITNDTRRNLVLIMDYHPNLKDLPKLIKNHLPTLYESPRMRNVFSDDKVQIGTGFRRTKNHKDLLVPSSLPVADQENSVNSGIIGCYRCHRQVCDACQTS